MKKSIVLVVLLTLVAFVSGAVAAAPPKAAGTAPAPAPAPAAPASTQPAKAEKFPGEIKSVDATVKRIVVAKGKEEKTFAIDDKTKIIKGKEALKLEDLKAGMKVIVEYKKDGDKNIATAIKLSHPQAGPKKK